MSHSRHHISPKPELSTPYQYGFNGMERQDELSGVGNNYNTLHRVYDARLGRWFSVDPKFNKYPFESAYVAFHNNPISWADPEGDDPPFKIDNGVLSGSDVVSDITSETHRPKMKSIDAVVLHRTVSSSASSAIRTTKNSKGNTGFHVVVDNDGTVTQVNNFENRANHVGKQKSEVGNNNSIGIEVVGNYNAETGTWDPLTNEQVESTAQVLVAILIEYDLNPEDVYPHEDVSWKTEGEGRVVQDSIWGRVEQLYREATTPPPVDSELEGAPKSEAKS